MGGIEHAARSVSAVLHDCLPWQRKTQRENLALLVATMLSERSAKLMSLAAQGLRMKSHSGFVTTRPGA